jgi:hypothetical protein
MQKHEYLEGDFKTPLLEQEGTASLASRGGRQVQPENYSGFDLPPRPSATPPVPGGERRFQSTR